MKFNVLCFLQSWCINCFVFEIRPSWSSLRCEIRNGFVLSGGGHALGLLSLFDVSHVAFKGCLCLILQSLLFVCCVGVQCG